MKRILFALLCTMPGIAMAQKSFVIEGKINTDSVLVGKIYLFAPGFPRDSVELKNNAYRFSGTLKHDGAYVNITWCDAPTEERVRRTGSMVETGAITFFLQSGNIRIEHAMPFKNKKITGSQLQTDYEAVIKKIGGNNANIDGTLKEYITTHPDSWLSYQFLKDRMKFFGAATSDSLYRGLSDNLKKDEDIQKLGTQITSAVSAGVGKNAPEFTMDNTEGKPVSLASYRGKYVLVDFWASWCAPCRAESPNVLAAYNQYKSKGFEVLSVSLDLPSSRDKWIEAIKKDGLTWMQVSDLKGLESPVAKLYGVTSIPANFLIDPSGKIIGTNLRGYDFVKRIGELIK